MMWVYKHTGSLWIAILMHASLDMFWMLSMPISISGKERMIWYVLWAIVLWSVAIIIGLVDAKKNVSNPKIT
jgi:membrane protease YdiL (CAAX protease family)